MTVFIRQLMFTFRSKVTKFVTASGPVAVTVIEWVPSSVLESVYHCIVRSAVSATKLKLGSKLTV